MVRVREMTAGDIDAVARIRVRGWRFAYAGIMPQAYLDGLSVRENAERLREFFARAGTAGSAVTNLVAEDAGAVTGWACFGAARDGDAVPGDGELYALYVRPELIGAGIGRALTAASLAGAAERGFSRLLLWVVRDNARARRFYERAGFAADGGAEAYEVAGVPVPEVRYALEVGRTF
ncbi:GNAT family N-acetyltransferase [Streptomyces sp. NPDC057654]|uniref:GNAT family N-acetyltransferase n=1 Tax=Streptomyces sp. NPDC057654 TaxID=3346196 RepID=UPI0036B1D6B9